MKRLLFLPLFFCACEDRAASAEALLAESRRRAAASADAADAAERVAAANTAARARFGAERDRRAAFYQEALRRLRDRLPDLPPGGVLDSTLLEIRDAEAELKRLAASYDSSVQAATDIARERAEAETAARGGD